MKVQPSSALTAVRVTQVEHKWQSNHYKVEDGSRGHWGKADRREGKQVSPPRQTGSLALSEGAPAGGRDFGSLISVRVSEAVKCGGKPKPWGRAQMVERSQGCKRSSALKGVRWLFHLRWRRSAKVTWCTKDGHCVDWQTLEDGVNAILHTSIQPKQKDDKADITRESRVAGLGSPSSPWDGRLRNWTH